MYNSSAGGTDGAGDGIEDSALVVADTPGQVRELYAWLRNEPELRGWVRLIEREPPQGGLGPIAEAVQVVTGAPGVAATIAGVVIAWLRYRTSDVKITVKRTTTSTEVEMTASRIKTLNADQTRALTAQIETALKDAQPPGEPLDG